MCSNSNRVCNIWAKFTSSYIFLPWLSSQVSVRVFIMRWVKLFSSRCRCIVYWRNLVVEESPEQERRIANPIGCCNDQGYVISLQIQKLDNNYMMRKINLFTFHLFSKWGWFNTIRKRHCCGFRSFAICCECGSFQDTMQHKRWNSFYCYINLKLSYVGQSMCTPIAIWYRSAHLVDALNNSTHRPT